MWTLRALGGFRVIIDDLMPIPEVTLSLVVGKEIQQAKKIPIKSSLSLSPRSWMGRPCRLLANWEEILRVGRIRKVH